MLRAITCVTPPPLIYNGFLLLSAGPRDTRATWATRMSTDRQDNNRAPEALIRREIAEQQAADKPAAQPEGLKITTAEGRWRPVMRDRKSGARPSGRQATAGRTSERRMREPQRAEARGRPPIPPGQAKEEEALGVVGRGSATARRRVCQGAHEIWREEGFDCR